MRIESERIKKVMKDVSQKEGNSKPYGLMCEILEYLQAHGNKPEDDKADGVKDLIDNALDEP